MRIKLNRAYKIGRAGQEEAVTSPFLAGFYCCEIVRIFAVAEKTASQYFMIGELQTVKINRLWI